MTTVQALSNDTFNRMWLGFDHIHDHMMNVAKFNTTEYPRYVHKGISGKSFTRDFRLAEHLEIASAKLEDGLLEIKLVLNVPDELQPQVIEIE